MNYEQKYVKALWQMKELYNRVKYLSSTEALLVSQTLENTFPELKESEDERIRRELIRDIDIAMPIETAQRYIAWLEKQGEQKSVIIIPKFRVGECIRYRGENYEIKDIEKTKDGFIYNVSIIGKPSDPEEIKTAIGIAAEKDMAKIEQPSTAWSEEDEQYLLVCKNALAKYQRTDKWDASIISRWLESLKDRVQPQPKQEWSEDDSWMLNVCCNAIDLYKEPVDKYLVKNWLKSLKPNHWKPSEEQMKALNTAVAVFRGLQGTYPIKDIESLYNDLKTFES